MEEKKSDYEKMVDDQVALTGEPRPTVYRTSPPTKRGAPKAGDDGLPDIGAAIFAMPGAKTAYSGFGVDGLKTFILQELLKLGGRALDDELAVLLGANEPVVRRALRATKMLALQWVEDSRQSQDVRLKCQALFDRIPTFSTGKLVAEPDAESGLPPVPPSPKRVGAVAGVDLAPGDKLHIITDLKGDHKRLNRLLKGHQLVDAAGRWACGPEHYLLVVGDLVNSSRYDAWGDVATEPFKVISALRQLALDGHIGFAAGNTDMALAKRTFFRHPRFGYSAPQGLPRLVQGLILARDFVANTASADPSHPYAAWRIEDGFFRLKPSHQLLGLPQVEVWANATDPDLVPLLELLDRIIEAVCRGEWTTPEQLADEIASILPMGMDDLGYVDSREALVEGLLQGTGTIEFFRNTLAAQWRIRGGGEVFTVSHSGVGAPETAQWSACKEAGWQLKVLSEFLADGTELTPSILPNLMMALASIGIQDVPSLVAWEGEEIALRAQQRRAIDPLCRYLGLKRDRAGFIASWDEWRARWMALDAGGLAGGDLDGGQSNMEVLGGLDDRAVAAYADTIWTDLFGAPVPHRRQSDGTILWDTPRWAGEMHIDQSVRVLRDGFGRVQLPMKHDLVLTYKGDGSA